MGKVRFMQCSTPYLRLPYVSLGVKEESDALMP